MASINSVAASLASAAEGATSAVPSAMGSGASGGTNSAATALSLGWAGPAVAIGAIGWTFGAGMVMA